MNTVTLIGRMVRDPELKSTQQGTSVLSFTIAVDRRISKEDKDKGVQSADFLDCVAWRQTAELIDRYVRKGNQIGISGRLQKRDYTDKDGKKVYVTEVSVDNVDLIGSAKKSEADEYLDMAKEFEPNPGKDRHRDMKVTGNDAFEVGPEDLPFY